MSDLFIGLMSGTSLDGADGVLVDFSVTPLQVRAFASAALPDTLRAELLALNASGNDELHRAALAANALVQVYAELVFSLLEQSGTHAQNVRAIGAHGQTVRHRPQEFDATGYTLQLNNPALLAELTGIDVVAEFRTRDVAAGGQGAPLVPPFHQAMFARNDRSVAVLNIGGISNVTLLAPAAREHSAAPTHASVATDQPQGTVTGFDCGPGNSLMDAWCFRHTGAAFDKGGAWAAGGTVHPALLQHLLAEPFFSKAPPKSTGRDLFNMPWLLHKLTTFPALAPQDVQATLAELTATSCVQSIHAAHADCTRLIVCGGGAFNTYLMQRLQALLPICEVIASDSAGLPAQQVEATAFAWLARQNTMGKTASLESVTGARGARILGALYQA